jgi:hypothetical protein
LACAVGALFLLSAGRAGAFPQALRDWQDRYGAISASGDDAGCQLCHANANGGSPWNAYGWDSVLALGDLACDRNLDGSVSNEEAFFCIETLNSDGDGGNLDNATEIGIGTQPGWTLGPFNTLYTRVGTIPGQLPPDDIGPVDPIGTPPPPRRRRRRPMTTSPSAPCGGSSSCGPGSRSSGPSTGPSRAG